MAEGMVEGPTAGEATAIGEVTGPGGRVTVVGGEVLRPVTPAQFRSGSITGGYAYEVPHAYWLRVLGDRDG